MLIKNLNKRKVALMKANKHITPTGIKKVEDYTKIGDYSVQEQILEDVISATIYGADINKMKRIASPLHDLEAYLLPKVENKEDNISTYYIFMDDKQYKITAVRSYYLDITCIGSVPNIPSL